MTEIVRSLDIPDNAQPLPTDTVVCEYCGLLQQQETGTEPGDWNDMGWWCLECIHKGRRRTQAQMDWELFAADYPKFALELKRLRKLQGSKE